VSPGFQMTQVPPAAVIVAPPTIEFSLLIIVTLGVCLSNGWFTAG
jgi:hypothetical protein